MKFMSTLAQQLCDEIVEPALKPTTGEDDQESSRIMQQTPHRDSKTTRSVVIERKKIVNKLLPTESDYKKAVVNTYKSKETLFNKTYADTAVNTRITGPLRCDNDCVTMVRKRDSQRCSCKWQSSKQLNKSSAKHIQTFAKTFKNMDKACTQCIETVSCGTQFLDKLVDIIPQTKDSKVKQSKVFVQPTISIPRNESFKMNRRESSSIMNNKPSAVNSVLNARRWALSQYPTRGPDF